MPSCFSFATNSQSPTFGSLAQNTTQQPTFGGSGFGDAGAGAPAFGGMSILSSLVIIIGLQHFFLRHISEHCGALQCKIFNLNSVDDYTKLLLKCVIKL